MGTENRDIQRTDAVLAVRGVTAGYTRPLLRDVTFDVARGEVFVILGGSGCGKSTILKHIIGLTPPLEGEIRILGDRISGGDAAETSRAKRHFGVTYQGGALFGSMTLRENVCLPLEAFTALPEDARNLLAEIKLEQVGLRAYADFFPAEISGGMRKRAAIARALALEPEILFLDEPSAGLDPVTSAELDRLILRLRDEQGVTVVMVTHELASIYAVADNCIMVDREAAGVIARGRPADLRDNPPNGKVRAFFNRTAENGHERE